MIDTRLRCVALRCSNSFSHAFFIRLFLYETFGRSIHRGWSWGHFTAVWAKSRRCSAAVSTDGTKIKHVGDFSFGDFSFGHVSFGEFSWIFLVRRFLFRRFQDFSFEYFPYDNCHYYTAEECLGYSAPAPRERRQISRPLRRIHRA